MLKDALACVGKYSSPIKALFASSESEASNTFKRKCSTIYRDCLYSGWSVMRFTHEQSRRSTHDMTTVILCGS